MSAPRVSVIVPHYHDLKGLAACLDALGRQSYPAKDFEIIVADNKSPEGEAAVAAVVAGRARLVVVTQKGAGPARNGGVALATGEILAFTDCDCVPEPQWLEEGLRALSSADFIGGRVIVLVEDSNNVTDVEAFERVFAFEQEAYITRKGFSVTANLMCPRALFDRVGEFRSDVSEDVDWCHRARAIGARIGYASQAVVGHPARRTWEELLKKWRRLNLESFHLMANRSRWLVRTMMLPLSAVAHTPKVLLSPNLATFGQRIGALRVLYQMRLWRVADAIGLLRTHPA